MSRVKWFMLLAGLFVSAFGFFNAARVMRSAHPPEIKAVGYLACGLLMTAGIGGAFMWANFESISARLDARSQKPSVIYRILGAPQTARINILGEDGPETFTAFIPLAKSVRLRPGETAFVTGEGSKKPIRCEIEIDGKLVEDRHALGPRHLTNCFTRVPRTERTSASDADLRRPS